MFTTIEVILKFSSLIITHHFLIAEIGDALATWFETRTSVVGKIKNMRGGDSTLPAFTLAELCYKTLLAVGVEAIAVADALGS